MTQITLSQKQLTALELLQDPQVVDLAFGGGAGGGKTMLVCLWAVLECRKFPGIRIGLGRKEMTRLKQTTLVTLLSKVHPLLHVTNFVYKDHKHLIEYGNGSQIQLFDLARQPSDPDFDTLGSLELTHTVIEEAGEVVKKARDVFGSRRNRYLNEKYGIVGKTIATLNPTQNFMREEFYEPYKKLGGGGYQKWESGDVYINDVKHTAYKVFVRSLVTDNPFVELNYIEVLKNLPTQERKRLLEGNWDYIDQDDMLFTYLLLDRAMTGELSTGSKYIGVDVADKGKDKTIATYMENGIIREQKRLEVDTSGEKAISNSTAMELIKFAQQRGFTDNMARQIAIEGNGVGVGVRDFMRNKGWFITEYTATANSRSQGFYNFFKHLDEGKTKIFNELETISELRKQLMAMTYEFKENLEPSVIQKKKLKEILGYSPDEADSAMICDWVANGSSDKRYNIKRIGY